MSLAALFAEATVKPDKATALRLTTVKEGGKTFATGRAVTFKFFRNTTPSPAMGKQFGQHLEPAGRFMSHMTPEVSKDHLKEIEKHSDMKFQLGTVTFKNPIVLALGAETASLAWKKRLSDYYGKKKKALSRAIRADGHDGIVTVSRHSGGKFTSEIVDLTRIAESLAEAFVEPITEGIHDKNILKAVFLAGAGGAGKSVIADEMFAGTGMKVINADKHLERFMREAKVPMVKIGQQYDKFIRARDLKQKELRHYAQQRLGLIIDSTGWDYSRISKPAKKLRELGYDLSMVFVVTKLDTALERNKKRGESGGRKVPDSFIETAWRGAMKNLKRYTALFGKKHMHVIDNDKDVEKKTWTSVVGPKLRKIANRILRAPITNPAGKAWLTKQKDPTTRDIDKPKEKSEWPPPPDPIHYYAGDPVYGDTYISEPGSPKRSALQGTKKKPKKAKKAAPVGIPYKPRKGTLFFAGQQVRTLPRKDS